MKKIIFLIMTGFMFLALSLAMAVDIPMMLNYQGYVEYGDGVPVNGTGYFKFAIVDPNVNTVYWSNDGTSTTGDEPNSAVPITVTNGIFAIKLGNTDMTNMSTALPTTVFEQQNIYVRVWFSDDETNFELLEPDTQIVSTGFAYKAQTVVDSAVNSTIIQDGTITNDDISNTASIDASKIDTIGLDADTLDGNDSSTFATADHAHNNYAGITHKHSGSDITSGTISADRVQYGQYFINSGGTDGQVWKSDGSGKGHWDTDNTGGGGGLWSQSENNIYYNSGNVGIGATNPKQNLHIYEDTDGFVGLTIDNPNIGPSSSEGIYFENEDGIVAGVVLNDDSSVYSSQMNIFNNRPSGSIHFKTKGSTRMILDNSGNVGIGTTRPVNPLDVFRKDIGYVAYLKNTHTGIGANSGLLIDAGQNSGDNILVGRNSAGSPLFIFRADGNVGIGTTNPQAPLEICYNMANTFWGVPAFILNNPSGGTRTVFSFQINGIDMAKFNATNGSDLSINLDGSFFIRNLSNTKTYLTINSSGNVGIGTTSPQGKLDVNGSIYQRGSQLHADYVFEPDYKLESIKEHAEFMWNNKHLKAIPKAQVDENGKEIVEIGTHQKGIVEELEKAHIYIEQLHNRLETLESELVALRELKDKLSKLEVGFSTLQ